MNFKQADLYELCWQEGNLPKIKANVMNFEFTFSKRRTGHCEGIFTYFLESYSEAETLSLNTPEKLEG